VDELREQYISLPAYEYDCSIPAGTFSEEEIRTIKKYGRWLNAIWAGEVSLDTEKLKSFYRAKEFGNEGVTRLERLWVKYKQLECPF
jgi:uncharacterized protein YifE (UPF0438 family)